jgi:anti-sigma regulatory factor (Ser/Thr protein kinase)
MADRKEQMEITIPSDFKYLGAVDAAVQDLARELACSQRWIDDFSTALIEAGSNAIEHGNRFAPDKNVLIRVNLNGRRIVTQIHDEGAGFNYKERIANPAPADPLSERGRGILIMQAFTDKLEFRERRNGGTCIELVKICDDGPTAEEASE